MSFVQHGRYLVMFAFRIESAANELWVELLERAYLDSPTLGDRHPPVGQAAFEWGGNGNGHTPDEPK